MRLLTRREALLVGAGMPFLACTEQKPEKFTGEFFSNGAVLNLDKRLKIDIHSDGLNTLVTEPNGGLKLPENYIIATIITPLLPSTPNDKIYASIPKSLEGQIQARFPKQIVNRKYSVSFLFSQDAVANVVRTIPRKQTPDKQEIEPDMQDIYRRLSGQLSAGWFFTVRRQYALERGLPIPSGQIPPRIAELISSNPPIEVLGMTEGAKFEN